MIHGAFKRLVGGHAAQLLTRGALIDPATALRMGLVDELCDAAQVPARALEVAREICALPREPMLRTRALARRDLVDLFGNPGARADPGARVRRDGRRDVVRARDAGAPQGDVPQETTTSAQG